MADKWVLLDGKDVYTVERGFYKYLRLREAKEAAERYWTPVWILYKGKSKKEYYVLKLCYKSANEKKSPEIKDINDFRDAVISYVNNTRSPLDYDGRIQPCFYTQRITEIKDI